MRIGYMQASRPRPARRHKHMLLFGGSLAAVTVALVLVLASAFASKGVLAYFGNASTASSTAGGEFSTASSGVGGVAVNKTTDDVYVVDRGNDRVEEFNASGSFVRAWGEGVVSAGPNHEDEMLSLLVSATAGDFVLTFNGESTHEIPFSASAATVQDELEKLVSIGTGDIAVSGGPGDATGSVPYAIRFVGSLKGLANGAITVANGSTPLSGGTGASIGTVNAGAASTGFEVCETQSGESCKAGSATATGGGMSAPQGVAVDQETGDVYVTDEGFLRVDEFSENGGFIRSWGQGVISGGSTGFDVCSAAEGDVCKTGTSASTGGAFLSTFSGYPAVAPVGAPNAGNVLVADPGNRRVQEFTASGAFVRAFGFGVVASGSPDYDGGEGFEVCVAANGDTCKVAASSESGVGQFATSQPTRVAEDTSGAIYTVENTTNYRVQKFTPQSASPPATPPLSPSVFAATVLSGSATTNPPTDVAVDPASNDVYVVKAYAAGEGNPSASVAERRVLRLNAAGELLETDMAGAEIESVNGLAENPASGSLYVSSTTGAQRVYVLASVPSPVVTVAETTAVGPHSATLNGTVNPGEGLVTSYQFEYSGNGSAWTKAPATLVAVGDGVSPVTVSEPISGLEANKTYQVRLFAAKQFNGASSTSEAQSFTTEAIAPQVGMEDMASAWWNEPAGIELSGQIEAGNLTTYYFEYGACSESSAGGLDACSSSEYEHRVPAGQQASVAGEGAGGYVLVHQQITGLQTDIPYHYRIIATNTAGTTTSDNNTIASHEQSYVYEQVTPVEKQAHDFTLAPANLVSPSGNAAVVGSLGGFESPEESGNFSASAGNTYVVHRTASGWKLFGTYAPDTLWPGLASEPFGAAFSPELEEVAGCGQLNSLLNGAELKASGFGCGLREADGSWQAGPAFPYPHIHSSSLSPTGFTQTGFFPASNDLSHIFFEDNAEAGTLLENQKTLSNSEGEVSVYEIEGLGTPSAVLRLVNVNDSEEEISGKNDGLGGGEHDDKAVPLGPFDVYHAVSEDGDVVFFTGKPSGGVTTVYARVDHSETIPVSGAAASQCARTASEAGGACNAAAEAVYQGASANGSKVFFTTTQQLVSADTDSTSDVYEYDFNDPVGKRIVQVSAGGVGDATPGTGADVQGVLSTSSDGSHVYFVAQGVLTTLPNARNAAAVAGADNLYGYDAETGETRFVAMLCSGSGKSGSYTPPAPDPCPSAASASDAELWSLIRSEKSLEEGVPAAQETPDGRYLVFGTYGKLITGGPEVDTNEAQQIYRYDFQTGELLRVSVGEPSFPASANGNTPGVNATIYPRPDGYGGIKRFAYADDNADDAARTISEDGEEIIFTTPERLQASDVNGAPGDTNCPTEVAGGAYSMAGCDVYLWRYDENADPETENQGQVSIVSDGQDPEGTDQSTEFKALGAFTAQPSISANGQNVFFTTRTPLVPADGESEEANVYDARIDGGFPGPAAEAACSGEACQGAPSPQPAFAAAPSSVFTAGQNLTAPPLTAPAETKESTGKVKITGHAVKAATITLTVKAPSKGKLTATGAGLKRATKTVQGKASYKLKLKLTSGEKKKLKRKKKLTVRVKVAFKTASGGSSSAKVMVAVKKR